MFSREALAITVDHSLKGDARVKDERIRADFTHVKRPAHWIDYRLQPDRIVLWETGWERMRPRHAAVRQSDSQWGIGDCQP